MDAPALSDEFKSTKSSFNDEYLVVGRMLEAQLKYSMCHKHRARRSIG